MTTRPEHPHLDEHGDAHGHDHHGDGHGHDHSHDHGHAHSHGLVDPSIVRSREGVKAVALSLAVLLATATAQLVAYLASDSVALLTDVIHNGGDALTALPLGAAFLLRSRRAERWAGYCVVLVILASALLALVQVVERLVHPQTPTHLLGLLVAGIIGVVGNEVAAVIRWRAGRRLDSPALVADGNHARADGYVSAGIVVSTGFVAVGLPLADPVIGLLISVMILRATWESWRTIRAA
ncbi:MAG: cation diffusion facilitator family transporter [Nocardioides sp.]